MSKFIIYRQGRISSPDLRFFWSKTRGWVWDKTKSTVFNEKPDYKKFIFNRKTIFSYGIEEI